MSNYHTKSQEEVIEKMKELESNYNFSKFIYTGYNKKGTIICSNGHEYEASYSTFIKGHRCKQCYLDNRNRGITEEQLNIIKSKYEILDNIDKIFITSKIKVKCKKCGSIKTKTVESIISKRCSECFERKFRTTSKDKLLETIKDKDIEFVDINEYKNNKSKMNFRCKSKGHTFVREYRANYRSNFSCPHCTRYKSKPEYDIIEYIQTFYKGVIIQGDRKTIPSPKTNQHLELDIYLPELYLAIEFNGDYWHTDEIAIKQGFNNIDEKHKYKSDVCKSKNIKLIHIDENIWINDKNYCLELIKKEIEGLVVK